MEFRKYYINNRSGLTFIEVLIVVSVLGLLLAVGVSQLGTSRRQAVLKQESIKAAQFVRETQNKSLSASNGTGWGVTCSGSTLTRFTLPNPEPQITETVALKAGVSCTSSVAELHFEKLTGEPNTEATLRVSSVGLTDRVITVRQPGTISL